MKKLNLKTRGGIAENIEKLKALFPEAVSETRGEDGELKHALNLDTLKTLLGSAAGDPTEQEFYEFTWPGKRAAIAEAAKPTTQTLRPRKEESKNWDTTQNLYIEGDNLEVLKLLQESYLGKVKMIYIDPPYNTGKDFIYRDNFHKSSEAGREDETVREADSGNKLFQNTEGNGRYHSDWCSMMYPRLKLAKNLLREDGVIFISIDDNEVHNLRKICDEVFGEENFVTEFVWKCRNSLQHDEPLVSKQTERILLFCKNKRLFKKDGIQLNRIRKPFDATEYKNPDNDPRGPWLSSGKTRNDGRPSYTVISPSGKAFHKPWIPSPNEFKRWEAEGLIWWGIDGNSIPRKKSFLKDFNGNAISDILFDEYTDEVIGDNNLRRTKRWEIGTTESGTKGEKEIFEGIAPFNYPKPSTLIKYIITITTNIDDFILDFFSGSATTAHACMQLNAEDGGKRKFIMVQLPEVCPENSEAAKAGYSNICEIGKERIRRAGEKIKAEHAEAAPNLDIGFRVLKLDSSSMKDVYATPNETSQSMLLNLESNIKEDRTPLDLLFSCLINKGSLLSDPITSETLDGVELYIVNDGEIPDLIACFAENIPETLVRKIAARKPLHAVFRDASFADSAAKINVAEIFKTVSPETTIKVL